MKPERAAGIPGIDAPVFCRRRTLEQEHPAGSGAIKTAARAFDDLDGLDIMKGKAVQVSLATRIRERDIVLVYLDVPYAEGRTERTATDIEPVAAR